MSDSIDRQKAIEAFRPYAEYESNRSNAEWVSRIELVLSELPSAEPDRKTGTWINVTNSESLDDEWKCSECGEELFPMADRTNFCPNCGAKMN